MRLLFLLSVSAAAFAQTRAPNFDDDVKPLLTHRCLTCHSAAAMRSGLNLETYAGVMKGGNSGDALQPGRASASLLYQVVAQEKDGVPRMPLGLPKLPDAEIALIREWIDRGARENARSLPQGPATESREFRPSSVQPAGTAVMPAPLAPLAPFTAVHPNPITALAASPAAPLIAVSGHDRIDLWDLSLRTLLGSLPFPEGVPYVLRFSRDGALLLAGGGRGVETGKVALYDVKTACRIATIGAEMDVVLAADVSPAGELVALGGPGKIVKVFDAATGKLRYQIKRHTDWITALAFSPDGKRLATADRSGGIHLWESATGGILVSLNEHKDSVTALSWRPDGRLLASASEDGQLIVWDATDGFPAGTAAKAHTPKPGPNEYGKPLGGVLSLEYMADGRIVSVGRDRTIRIWSSEAKPLAAARPFDELPVKTTAAFDAHSVVAGDFQGRLFLWDLRGDPVLLGKR